MQQQLPGNTVLTVAYVGSQGRNLFLRSITNKIVSVGMNPTTGAAIVNREFGNRFAEIDYKTSGGNDHYNSLQVTANRRFAAGLSLGAQYTWGAQHRQFGRIERSQHRRQSVQLQGRPRQQQLRRPAELQHDGAVRTAVREGQEVPGVRLTRRRYGLLGGWQLGGIVNARTGVPVDMLITRPDILYHDTRDGKYLRQPGEWWAARVYDGCR